MLGFLLDLISTVRQYPKTTQGYVAVPVYATNTCQGAVVQFHTFLKLEMDEGGQLDETIALPLGKQQPPPPPPR